jgi:solute carrier family 29 (equilibrative nucleoside transporter) protein 4
VLISLVHVLLILGAAGLAVSIDRIVTKAAFESCKTSALVFFGISLVFNVFCALLFEFVQRTSFVRHHVALCHQPLKEEKYENSIELLALNAPSGSPTRQIVSCKRRQIFTKLRNGWHTRMLVSKRLWRLMVTIGLVYFVTLLLFPGLLSEVRGDSFHDDWLPVVLIAAFNLFDFIGKVISAWHYEWKENHLVSIGFVRFIFVPLLALCIVPCYSPAFGSTSAYIAMSLSALLGITNGYFGCMAMVLSPSRVEPQLREVAGLLLPNLHVA